jgi:hypothetical protein
MICGNGALIDQLALKVLRREAAELPKMSLARRHGRRVAAQCSI